MPFPTLTIFLGWGCITLQNESGLTMISLNVSKAYSGGWHCFRNTGDTFKKMNVQSAHWKAKKRLFDADEIFINSPPLLITFNMFHMKTHNVPPWACTPSSDLSTACTCWPTAVNAWGKLGPLQCFGLYEVALECVLKSIQHFLENQWERIIYFIWGKLLCRD